MSEDWQSALSRWRSAGLLDDGTAESIREWERQHGEGEGPNRFAVIAFGLGGLLLIAGVLLFVASNWQQLSPLGRFALLSATVALFHAAGGLVGDSRPALATTLHAAGTGALGGAIFLSGQTFHLAENWPEGFLLWALGAGAALFFLRDWPHVLYTAVLAPLWLASEAVKVGTMDGSGQVFRASAAFGVLLAVAYLFARMPAAPSVWRKSLSRLGAVALIPLSIALGVSGSDFLESEGSRGIGPLGIAAWALAIGVPCGLAYLLRGKDAAPIGVAVIWVLVLGLLDPGEQLQFLGLLAAYAAGSVGLVLWGLRDKSPLPVNLGVAGFALSIFVFYFASDLFSKLGRSVGLIGAGLLFIGGGLLLERTRRTIIGRMEGAAP